jgi:hypothetical protein
MNRDRGVGAVVGELYAWVSHWGLRCSVFHCPDAECPGGSR